MAFSLSLLSKSHFFKQTLKFPKTLVSLSTSTQPIIEDINPNNNQINIENPNNDQINNNPLPISPATSLHISNWRNPSFQKNPSFTQSGNLLTNSLSLIVPQIQTLAQTLDSSQLANVFASWTPEQRFGDIKLLFESWVRVLDKNGKPNKPNVELYNNYLRANVMLGSSVADLLDLVAKMDDFGVEPNTGSFNLVLKAMALARETEAAEKLIQRMLQTGKDSRPDDESYDLVIGMLFVAGQFDSALKYVDMTLKSKHTVSVNVFNECVRTCVNKGRLDALVSIIERCKNMDQNKDLCPPWALCNNIAEVAMQADNSELAYYALEFLAKWIVRGEKARPQVFLSVEEGLIVATLGTAGRTYNSKLLDGSWSILKRSLRQKKMPNPETYIAKIYAQASLGNLPNAFGTLHEFETAYENSTEEAKEDLFSPFTSLYPLVVACSKNGFTTLDSVYYQLENLSKQADRPYKSVAALNCIILGCANIWDEVRAYQTFEAISDSFKLTPNIHSYNALISVFGKLKKTDEASKVFTHMISMGVKPNAMTYSLLVDAHLGERDPKAALSVVNEMVNAGFEPSREMLKKVRRRCIREMDSESNGLVESLARRFNIRMAQENRRDLLFNLNYGANYA